MIGSELNGLFLSSAPAMPTDGFYPFCVLERYYGQGKGGDDLCVSYLYWVPAEDVQFSPMEFAGVEGVVMLLRPSAFARLEKSLAGRRPNDVSVYPRFVTE